MFARTKYNLYLIRNNNPIISHILGEFWLGLDNIHSLSRQGEYVLQVELSDEAGQQQAARYKFQLEGEQKMFALHLQQESSTAQEEILTTDVSGLPFSTADRDNDLSADVNCAELLSGTNTSEGPSLKDLIRTMSDFLKCKVGNRLFDEICFVSCRWLVVQRLR